MNANAKQRKPVNRQMIIFGLLALAVVYHFSRPTLEKWTGMSLPAIVQEDEQPKQIDSPDFRYDAKLPESAKSDASVKADPPAKASASRSKSSPAKSVSPAQAARNWLTDIGRDRYRSPAGLIYGGGKEHRIDHVLRHCVDDPSKPVHGVFSGDAVEVMKLVDEAYELVKSGSNKVQSQKSGDKMTYTVSMGRSVGFTGGSKAKSRGRKELRKVKLVLADDRVITAFPK